MARRDPTKKRNLKKVAKSGRQKALTNAPPRIHCVATPASVEADKQVEATGEMDQLAIDGFLDALAEIALSVAARETTGAKERHT